MSADGWWYRASTDERLAQIDAGIELGMTASQIALNCGCLYDQDYSTGERLGSGCLVRKFAHNHGRDFSHSKYTNRDGNGMTVRAGRALSRKKAKVEDIRKDFFEGAPVDLWRGA